MLVIKRLDFSNDSFVSSLSRQSLEVQESFFEVIQNLIGSPPFPKKLRFEKLSGYSKPNIYTVHVTANHSHKASFELIGDVAMFRRIGTHKEIDRDP